MARCIGHHSLAHAVTRAWQPALDSRRSLRGVLGMGQGLEGAITRTRSSLHSPRPIDSP